MRRLKFACLVVSLCIAFASPLVATDASSAGPATDLAQRGPAVSGTVSFGKEPLREQAALPGMATLRVELLEVSGKTPGTRPVGEDTVWIANGKLPIGFRIAYDPSRIDPARRYVIRARILEEDKVLYMNTISYYVLTAGAPGTVDIIVTPAQVRIR